MKKFNFKRKYFFIFLFLAIGIYLFAFPFVPELIYTHPESENFDDSKAEKSPWIYKPEEPGNKIIMPSISLNLPIIESDSDSALNSGIWKRPNTGTPESGNMVLTGHRFRYGFLSENFTFNNSFYHLDKLDLEDRIFLEWEGGNYEYRIIETKIVDRSEVEIESQDLGDILTLYTCHPIGFTNKRLVHIAIQV